MEHIIQEIAETISNNFSKELQKLVKERKDISEFILEMKRTLDGIGTRLCAEALESVNEAYRRSPDRKRKWVVKSKADPNTLATIFGEVKYKRTYFESKKTGEFAYLSDEAVGIKVYDRMDASLKAKLIDEASETAYRRSGEKAAATIRLSSQTVMNSIRELGAVANDAVPIRAEQKKVSVLYIEADEDHVALQTGGCAEPKIVYVHEGRKKVGKDRWELKNARYFSGMYTDSEQLWLEVADYIDAAYDSEAVKKIYLSGDGANWIRKGAEWIVKSTYVLDRYHLSKYVTIATAHMAHTTPVMWRYINQSDKANLKKLFTAIVGATESKRKKEAVNEARKYIFGNWSAIENQYMPDYVGCSAEGHVSHILSARLSSRPLGWSRDGVDQMARLRTFKANGGNVYQYLLALKQAKRQEMSHVQADRSIIHKRELFASRETIGNLTVLNIGKKTHLSDYLKSVRDA